MPARARSLMILNRNMNRTRSLLMLHWDIKMLFNAGKCETKEIRGVSRCYLNFWWVKENSCIKGSKGE
ncbi:hypothetical protein HBI56_216990 [Parastagonospora nodorum]|nr:hypothetical protein HBI10_009660 [Parastagonospora nodorum]KAH4023662.1 hypothetical protein HBI13_091370 [Parastagonospora nodorum]KAH4940754.1 hypothetical protein HBH74_067170 [Parastagonospora nodorum]KAH4975678.1 hypothetical protein HBH73_043950 [Parastagonospora nodorum]KAH5110245.1 hypothetical protein HBH72_030270 [Parastagonospora nodorum]